MTQRGRIILSRVLAGFYALALPVWPLAILPAIMGTDSMSTGTTEYNFAIYVILSTLFYPVYWALGFYFGRHCGRHANQREADFGQHALENV